FCGVVDVVVIVHEETPCVYFGISTDLFLHRATELHGVGNRPQVTGPPEGGPHSPAITAQPCSHDSAIAFFRHKKSADAPCVLWISGSYTRLRILPQLV